VRLNSLFLGPSGEVYLCLGNQARAFKIALSRGKTDRYGLNMRSEFIIYEYTPSSCMDILLAIGEDPDWQTFTKSKKQRDNYKKLLKNSATLVCYTGNDFCGYIRAVLDEGFAIYISELFVKPKYRDNKIAQKLIERIKEKFSSIAVYALSDEDFYYQKKGYKKVGSIFEIYAT
jgi:hypothetical protein